MTTKEAIKQLVDQLPESELETVRRFLEYVKASADPVWNAFLNAPLDDEPETEEERSSVEEARRDFQAGNVISLEELDRKLGQ